MAGDSAKLVQQGAFEEGIDLSTLEGMMLRNYRSLQHARITDPKRLEQLYGSRFWQQPDQEKLNEFCNLAVRILGAAAAHVVLLADTEAHVIASSQPPMRDAVEPIDWTYCSNIVGTSRALSIQDARNHTLVCDLPATVQGGIRSYLGVPLVGSGGAVIGSFCVVDTEPRSWSSYDVTWMTQIAGAILSFHEHGVA